MSTTPTQKTCVACGRNPHKVAARVDGKVVGFCAGCWDATQGPRGEVVYDRRAGADRHGVFARTRVGNYRIGGWSDWRNAQRRWSAATDDGRTTRVEVRARVGGEWATMDGEICVRSFEDPGFAHAEAANRKGTSATVRSFDFRKVR